MKTLPSSAAGPLRNAVFPARRGFSTVAIIVTMIFIAMAVASMTTLFTHEARRTRAALAQSQLRQLLLAAVPAAQAEIRTPGRRDVPLTVPLDGAAVTLHVDGPTVRVVAAFRGVQASQTLVFQDGQLASTTLDQTAGQ